MQRREAGFVAMVEWVRKRSKRREEKRRSLWMLGCSGGGEEEEERGKGRLGLGLILL